ncbi:MAG TPA: ATP-binding protein [Polyangiaceae bacterium]
MTTHPKRQRGDDGAGIEAEAFEHRRAKENPRIGVREPARQGEKARHVASSGTARVHLLLGPVGAGKSTFALELAREHAAVRLTLDEWMTALFQPDRPQTGVIEWYVERAGRCVDQIWSVAEGILDAGVSVILEIGLLQRHQRETFYGRVSGRELTIHVLDAAREVRRARVEQRNRMQGATFSMVVPPAVFELASDLWEPPDSLECEGREVRVLRTDR